MKYCIWFLIIALGSSISPIEAAENIPAANPAVLQEESRAIEPDQIIEQLLVVSGLKQMLQKFQTYVNPNRKTDHSLPLEVVEFQKTVINLYAGAYPEEGFLNQAKDTLKDNYDEKRYLHLLKSLSTPLSLRLRELQSAEPTVVDLQDYLSLITSHPLSSRRVELIRKLDSAMMDDEILIAMKIAVILSNTMALAGNCNISDRRIDRDADKKRPKMEKDDRNQVRLTLAFVYRNISDEDLAEYLKTYEHEDMRWFQEQMRLAIDTHFKSGIRKVGAGMRDWVHSKTLLAPECKDRDSLKEDQIANQWVFPIQAFKPNVKEMPKQYVVQKLPSVSGRDLTSCLELKTYAEIAACAGEE